MHRSEDRTHAGMPDPMSPHYNLQPINFDKWNGQVINPIEAYYKRGRGDYKQRTMFQASHQTPKDKPKSQKGADNEEAELDDLLDGIPDL